MTAVARKLPAVLTYKSVCNKNIAAADMAGLYLMRLIFILNDRSIARHMHGLLMPDNISDNDVLTAHGNTAGRGGCSAVLPGTAFRTEFYRKHQLRSAADAFFYLRNRGTTVLTKFSTVPYSLATIRTNHNRLTPDFSASHIV